jgi:hypothetical protein
MGHHDTDDTALRLLAAIREQMPLADFAAWLYAQERAPAGLDPALDGRLLAIDYALPEAITALRAVAMEVLRQHRPDLYVDESIRLLLCGLASGVAPLIPACAQLSWYRASGAAWIPDIFAGLDSERIVQFVAAHIVEFS